MAVALSVENLFTAAPCASRKGGWLKPLLALEAWLDRRASGRALYRLDGRDLADLALSQADIDRINGAPDEAFRR